MKKGLYSAFALFLIVAIIVGITYKTIPEESNELVEEPHVEPTVTVDEQITSIVNEAKLGTVPNFMGTVGVTMLNEVESMWVTQSSPANCAETENGVYIDYPEHETVIGAVDELVFDIRYSGKPLPSIRYEDIKRMQGDPQKIRTFNDDTHDQIILVYQVTDVYQLKWILPKPTDGVPNPAVDHIAVWTKVESMQEKMLDEMTLDEKIGQLIIAGIDGTDINAASRQLIEQQKIGGVIFYSNNVETPDQTVQFVNSLKDANKSNRLPMFFSIDQEGGRVSRLPKQVEKLPTSEEIGKVNDSQYAFNIGRALGMELVEFGFNMNFAPVLDVNSNPNNPVIGNRSFSADPKVVSSLGVQTMKGIEKENVIPVVKHFPGHGDTSVDSHLELPKVNKTMMELEQLELIPFKKAIEENADVIMIAHILLPELDKISPASMSEPIITNLLRNELGFNGIIMTDDLTMKAITNHYGIAHAAVESFKAGSDILLVAHDPVKTIAVLEALKAAVASGEISESRIDASVARIVSLKDKYSLVNQSTPIVGIQKLNKNIRETLKK
ncbi:beta-N-acetylhexosaminidase [Sporosarcina siberiensis]|uniref:beta-N-acetylhexosaminidase n=1 Tax=Sporosarcina siberiensis TaxID=1365606 RepID=A0ABW4SIS8_9BACL